MGRRFGVPSLRFPGVPYWRRDTSSVGLTEGVASATVSSEVEGEPERGPPRSCATGLLRRAERRMARGGPMPASGALAEQQWPDWPNGEPH